MGCALRCRGVSLLCGSLGYDPVRGVDGIANPLDLATTLVHIEGAVQLVLRLGCARLRKVNGVVGA